MPDRHTMEHIPLYTVKEYKGLEAPAIVLLLVVNDAHLETDLYVGLSRAVAYVHLVMDNDVYVRVRSFWEGE